MWRSAFAARFSQLVGEPAVRYVTRWKMHAALMWLKEENAALRFDRSPHAYPVGYRVVDAGAGGDARSWMDLLVPLQHPDELLDPPGAGLRLLRGLNPEEDRVPVGAVQRFEEGLRLSVLRHRDQKIFRYGGTF